jgi:hypothetical protein
VRIFFERRLFVDEGEGIRERGQKGGRREFKAEDDGLGVGRLDLVDYREML